MVDAELSGVTANPAVGFCTDLLVRAGATALFSETTEVRDAIEQMTARATTPEVADAMAREMAWYDAYLGRGQADRSANTTPGNKAGGLSNIVEKAMGSIIKSGTAPISGVLSPEAAADLSRIVDKIGCSKLTAVTIALRAYVADRLDKRRR